MALDSQKNLSSGEFSSPRAKPLSEVERAPSRGERQKIAKEKEYQEKIEEAIGQPVKPAVAAKSQTLPKKTGQASSQLDYPKIREAVLKELQNLTTSLKPAVSKKTPVQAEKKEIIKEPAVKTKISLPPFNFINILKEYLAKKKDILPSKILPKMTFKFKFSLKRLLLPLLFLIIILLVIVSLGIYLGSWDQPSTKIISKIIPYPVLYVDGQLIYARDFFDDLGALKKYLIRQGLPINEPEARKQVLESLVEKAVLEKLAEDKNIFVGQSDTQAEMDLILSETGVKEEAEKLINDLYGWTLSVYQEKIIRPVLLARELEAAYYQDGDFSQLKKRLSDYRGQLLKTPEKFSEIAGQINEDATKFVGGDLGWFSLGDMVPEFEAVVLDLKEGQLSEVFESRFGFHLVKLEEKVMEAGQPTFHAAHLFLKRASFADYLAEQIKKARVLTLIKI